MARALPLTIALLSAAFAIGGCSSGPREDSVLTFIEVLENGVAGVEGLDNPKSLAMSSDGKHLYVASDVGNSLSVFSRDSATGHLAFVEVHRDGEGGVDGLDFPVSLVVSPDDKHVYVASVDDNSIAVFRRDTTGALTFVETLKDGAEGGNGLEGASSVAVSPDGVHVYAVGLFDEALSEFRRDPATGTLKFVNALRDPDGGPDRFFRLLWSVVSPDGLHVYAGGGSHNAIPLFTRQSTPPSLTYITTYLGGEGSSGFRGIGSAVISPDGKQLYAASAGDSVTVLNRDGATGVLTFSELIKEGRGEVAERVEVSSLAMTPDGKLLFASGRIGDTLTVFNRNATTGALTFIETQKDGERRINGLKNPVSIAVSPDGQHIYVAAGLGDSIVVFSVRDLSSPSDQ